jgi:hypothetical protein
LPNSYAIWVLPFSQQFEKCGLAIGSCCSASAEVSLPIRRRGVRAGPILLDLVPLRR